MGRASTSSEGTVFICLCTQVLSKEKEQSEDQTNMYVDSEQLKEISRFVTRGFNGLDDRLQQLARRTAASPRTARAG
jgi:hypothetical protein